jgi:hypothetical protein
MKRIRFLLKSDGTPDCPICLSDVAYTISKISKDSALLEYENNLRAVKDVKEGVRMIEIQILEIKRRLREEVYPEIKEYLKNKPKPQKPESHKAPLKKRVNYREEQLRKAQKEKREMFQKKRLT